MLSKRQNLYKINEWIFAVIWTFLNTVRCICSLKCHLRCCLGCLWSRMLDESSANVCFERKLHSWWCQQLEVIGATYSQRQLNIRHPNTIQITIEKNFIIKRVVRLHHVVLSKHLKYAKYAMFICCSEKYWKLKITTVNFLS